MERWSSRLGFLLATIGSAVGIGNIWRFSSVVGQNGGGAYLIPYLLAVFGFVFPLMILELAVGRHLRGNVVSAFRKVGERFQVFGWLVWIIVFSILSYYLVITGWTLAYLVFSVTNLDVTFLEFTSSYQPIIYFAISSLIMGLVVSLGVRRGIEKITSILIPFSFIILIAMALFSTTLSGFTAGLSFFLTPDFTVLSNPMIWSAAFGQAFFSLSVGFGVLITYGGYLDRDTDIPRSSLIVTIADLMVAMLAGLVIFPVVFTFGLEPTMGAELAFSTLPKAFELIPSGQILAVAFFLLIFFAALTSAISMMEVNVAAVMETTKMSRGKTSLILTILILLLGLPSALSYSSVDFSVMGVKILDLMDGTVGTMGLPITALFIAVIFTWFLEKGFLGAQIGASRLNTLLVLPATKYVIPAVLIIITSSRLLLSFDFPGWHFIPRIEFIGSLAQGVTTLLMIALLLVIARFLRRLRLKLQSP